MMILQISKTQGNYTVSIKNTGVKSYLSIDKKKKS